MRSTTPLSPDTETLRKGLVVRVQRSVSCHTQLHTTSTIAHHFWRNCTPLLKMTPGVHNPLLILFAQEYHRRRRFQHGVPYGLIRIKRSHSGLTVSWQRAVGAATARAVP